MSFSRVRIFLTAASALAIAAAQANGCSDDPINATPLAYESLSGSTTLCGYSKYADQNEGSIRKYRTTTVSGTVTQAWTGTADTGPDSLAMSLFALTPNQVTFSGCTPTGGIWMGGTNTQKGCPPYGWASGTSGVDGGNEYNITNGWHYPDAITVTPTTRKVEGKGTACRDSGSGELRQILSDPVSFYDAMQALKLITPGGDSWAYMTGLSTTTPGTTTPITISGEAVKVKATFDDVCPNAPYQILYSYQSKPHGATGPIKSYTKSETYEFKQSHETIERDIDVDAVNTDYTIVSVQAQKSTSACQMPLPGASNNTWNSVHTVINLGRSYASGHDLWLLINQQDITPAIYTPQDLQVSDNQSADVKIVPDGTGALRQVMTPQDLADVVTLSASSYQVNLYYPSQVGTADPATGIFPVSGTPFYSYLIENPDAGSGTATRFRITDISPSRTFATTYSHDPVTNAWTMDKGGLRTETIAQTTDQAGNLVKTITVAGPDQVPVSVTAKTYQNLPWGQVLIKQVDDPAGAALTTTWIYYTNLATDGSNYQLLRQKITPTGYWETYSYDSQGRIVQTVAQFQDTAPDSPASLNRVTTITYSTLPDSDGDSTPESLQTTVVTLLGQEISRSYEIIDSLLPTINGQSVETREEIQCTVAGAAWNDPANLVTKKQRIVGGLLDDKPLSQLNPDGTLTIYAYTSDATTITTTSYTGAASTDGTTVTAGTKTVTVTTLIGQPVSTSVSDYDSSRTPTDLLLSSQVTSQQDAYGRPTRIDYLDGTYELLSYACCGLDSDTDREGIATTYDYTPLSYVDHTTRAGITQNSTLDPDGRILAVTRIGTDSSSIVTETDHYDLAGRHAWTKDALGRQTSFAEIIDGNGHTVKTTTYPDGGTRIETSAKDGSLLSVTGTAAAQQLSYQYGVDANGAYTQEIHVGGSGQTTEWIKTYPDFAGRPSQKVYADGATEQSSYNNLGQLVKQADADGVTTLFGYNVKGEQEYTALDLDRNGSIDLGGTDRITQTHSDVLTDHGVTVQRTTTTVWTTNNSGATQTLSTVETTPEGRQTWQTSYGLTTQTQITYGGSGARTETTTAPDGTVIVKQFQNDLLMSQAVSSLSTQLSALNYGYDPHHRLQTTTDARTGATTYAYFNDDQIQTVTTPDPDPARSGPGYDPQTTIYGYDSAGRQNQVTQPDGGIVNTTYYPTGQVQTVSGARTYPVQYTYDTQGRVKTLTTWQNHAGGTGAAVTTWNYDPQRGWLTSKLAADGQGPAYTYYPSGRLKTRTWARGIITAYGYNAAGDLAGSSYSDATPAVALTYDRLGRLLTTADAAGACTWTYDPVSGQVSGESYSSGLLNGLSVARTFDALNRLGSVAVPAVSSLIYNYDAASRLNTVTSGANTATYGYVPNSNLVGTVTFANSGTTRLTTTKMYDNLNRLVSVSSVASATSAFNYDYNAANQRVKATREDGSYWGYGYDPLGQVTSGARHLSTGDTIAGDNFAWTYDDIGNRQTATANSRLANYSANLLNQYLSRDVPGAVDITGTANVASAVMVNQRAAERQGSLFYAPVTAANASAPAWLPITIIGLRAGAGPGGADLSTTQNNHAFIPKTPEAFAYDADGNLLSDGRWIYTWDAENRLISLQTAASAASAGVPNQRLEFAYDYQGRRVQKKVSNWNGSGFALSSDTRYIYDDWNLLAELNALAGNAAVRTYVWGLDMSGSMQGAGGVGGLLALSLSNGLAGTYAPAYDGNGNVISLVNAADGSDAADFEYGAFGETVKAVGPAVSANPFRFSTKYADSETGLAYYGLRYYNPGTGKWLSRDPAEEEGGINLYGFCANDGINGFDPYGLEDKSICSRIKDEAQNFYNWASGANRPDPGPWQLLYDFAHGGTPQLWGGQPAPSTFTYGQNTSMVQSLMASDVFQNQVLPKIKESVKAGLRNGKFNASLSHSPWYQPLKDITGMASHGLLWQDVNVSFVGSWTGDWQVTQSCCCLSMIAIHGYNPTSAASLTRTPWPILWRYGYPSLESRVQNFDWHHPINSIGPVSSILNENPFGPKGPMTTIGQYFDFTVPINTCH